MTKETNEHDTQRITLATALLATELAFIAIAQADVLLPFKFIVGVSGLLLFLFLLFSAANLASNTYGFMRELANERGRLRAYNWGLEIYGIALIGGSFTLIVVQEWWKRFLGEVMFNPKFFVAWVFIIAGFAIQRGALYYIRYLRRKKIVDK